MTVPRADATAAWKPLGQAERKEIFRLAATGQQHPDPAMAAAAYAWSHSESWDRIWNRVPGWLLPLVGVVGVVLMIVGGFPVILAIGFGVSILFGLLGWLSKNSAARLRRVYTEGP